MKSIGIKLADGSFYPVMEDGKSGSKTLQLTTVKDNQTTVKVDLYQSETGSMADAEYLDTLQIEDLNPHPNGEPDFNLSLSLDDDNNLSAQVNDPETNRSASKDVPFIKRSADERAAASPIAQADDITDIDLNDFDEVTNTDDFEPTKVEDTPLESAPAETESTDDFSDLGDLDLSGIDEVKAEDEGAPTENASESDVPEMDDFDLSGITDNAEEKPAEEENAPAETESADDFSDLGDLDLPDIDEEKSEDEGAPDAIETEDVDLADFGMEDTAEEEPIVEKAPVRDATDADSDIPAAEDEPSEEDDGISLDITTSIPVDEEGDFDIPEQKSTANDFDLPDMDEPNFEGSTESATDDLSLDLPDDMGDFGAETSASDDSSAEKNSDFDTDSLDLDSTFGADETDSTPADFALNETASPSDFDMPEKSIDMGSEENSADTSFDMDSGSFASSDSGSFDLPDLDTGSESGTVVSDSGLDLSDLDNDPAFSTSDFDVPDFDSPKNASSAFNFDDDFNDPAFALPGTSNYDSSSSSSSGVSYGEEKRRGGVSVAAVICVICAIICLLATALALFVLPSKVNVQSLLHLNQDTAAVVPAENTENAQETLPTVAPKAQENAIVVSPIAEVVPEKPALLSEITEDVGEDGEKKNVEGIRYIVHWGDTLWDISNTYYRNPWLYPRIAKYNNITDPDFIVSGTPIIIPK